MFLNVSDNKHECLLNVDNIPRRYDEEHIKYKENTLAHLCLVPYTIPCIRSP